MSPVGRPELPCETRHGLEATLNGLPTMYCRASGMARSLAHNWSFANQSELRLYSGEFRLLAAEMRQLPGMNNLHRNCATSSRLLGGPLEDVLTFGRMVGQLDLPDRQFNLGRRPEAAGLGWQECRQKNRQFGISQNMGRLTEG